MPRGKLKGDATALRRQEILKAALTCFTTKGYTDTTMTDIQTLSGASIGSIYHHFENKEGLALALYLEGLNDLHTQLLAAVANNPPAEEGVKALVKSYLEWFKLNPDWGHYLYFAVNAEYLSNQSSMFEEITQNFILKLQRWFLPYIETGQMVRLDLFLYEPLIIGSSRDYMRRWLLKQDSQELEGASSILAEVAWKVVQP